MNTSVKWAAELAHVREVSLLGTADLAFWKDRLLKEEHSEVLQALMDSHFVAKEWIVREDATHAKSKTYKRADLLPREPYAEPDSPSSRGRS